MAEKDVNARHVSVKAFADPALASVLLVLAAPVMLLAALVVKLTSRGPILYSQTRAGLNGRPYTIYKIRTMYHDPHRAAGPRWATPGDPRITPLGKVLRRTHLDELPQLWNVLRGEMSLVGPRPEQADFVAALEQAVPHYRDRLRVRPGMTGLAQVQLPPDTDLACVRRKLAYDRYYVDRATLWLDLRILLTTAGNSLGIPLSWQRKVLKVPGAEEVEGKVRPGTSTPLPPAGLTISLVPGPGDSG